MPLNTEVLRFNPKLQRLEPRKDIVWDYFALSAMYTVAVKEGAPKTEYQDGKCFGDLKEGQWVDFSMAPIYYLDWPCKLIKKGEQIVKETHVFNAGTENELEFRAGDVLRAWRSHKS